LPAEWQMVCPYIDHGTYLKFQKLQMIILSNFVNRSRNLFGEMKFYSEKRAGNCTVKFGVLKADQSWSTKIHLSKQEDVDFYAQRTATAVEKFNRNIWRKSIPYYINVYWFCSDKPETYNFPGTREITGGYQYWPPNRYDELIGHLLYSWFCFPNKDISLISSYDLITKGLGESYLGCKMAYELSVIKRIWEVLSLLPCL